MRGVKFRAWDIINKVMFIPEYLMFDEKSQQHQIADLETDVGRRYSLDGYLDGGLSTDNNTHWILMQYTNWYDNSGRRICEHDLIRCAQAEVNHVFWAEDLGMWCISNFHSEALALHDYLSDIDILGNIYENPKLLDL